ncbi:MAG: glycosyltransferase family 2 protein [Lachnospiraceae bacterium]
MSIITIITPAYNAGDTIEKAIHSMTSQSYRDLSIILLDDGSEDNTLDIMEQAAAEDSRIRVLKMGTHHCAASARNTGLQVVPADCKYVYFADADDYLEPNAIEVMVGKMEETGADLLTFGYRQIRRKDGSTKEVTAPEGRFTGAQIRSDYTAYTSDSACKVLGSCWNKCFRMDRIREYEVKFPGLQRNEEEVFIMEYLKYAETICNIPDILYNFYPIDMQRAFERLPESYCQDVEVFRINRLQYAQGWNCDNQKTREFIAKEYWGKMILGLKLCFNPKKPLGNAEFRKRMKQLMNGLKEIGSIPVSVSGSTLYKLMKLGMTPAVKMLLKRGL